MHFSKWYTGPKGKELPPFQVGQGGIKALLFLSGGLLHGW